MAVVRVGSNLMRFGGGIHSRSTFAGNFVPNASGDYDYLTLSTIPDTFGDGEFCLALDVEPTASGVTVNGTPISTGSTASVQTWRWSSDNEAIYSTPSGGGDWWWRGNFLLDGHNNNSFSAGTFSVQIAATGRVQWTFGDGAAAAARVGGVHGLRGTTDIRGKFARIYLVRRNDGGSGSELELWVDGVLEDSETSTARTNMATTYWDGGFPAYPANQRNWMFGTEKQAAVGVLSEYEDYFGLIHRVRFYASAPSTAELRGQSISATPVGDYDFREGSGTTVRDRYGGPSMTVVNADPAFWESV